MRCPRCDSINIVKNGSIHNGKKKFKCKDCGRQFVKNPAKKQINKATKELIDRLLLERVALAGIARVTCFRKMAANIRQQKIWKSWKAG